MDLSLGSSRELRRFSCSEDLAFAPVDLKFGLWPRNLLKSFRHTFARKAVDLHCVKLLVSV